MDSKDPGHHVARDTIGDTTSRSATRSSRGGGAVDGIDFTNLDTPILEDDETTKRQLIEYLRSIADRLIPELADRPLSVIRVPRGGSRFMWKHMPSTTPTFVRTATFRSASPRGRTSYAVCDDLRTLLWLGNLRAVEFHPALVTVTRPDHQTHLVLDIDPPSADHFAAAVDTALLVRRVLEDVGLRSVVKTSGAKGVHVLVPVGADVDLTDSVAATRAIAARAAALDTDLATVEFKKIERRGRVFIDATRFGAATVVAAFSPRARPGFPVSFPIPWDDLTDVRPSDFTIHNVSDHLREGRPWLESLPRDQRIPDALLAEGRELMSGPVHGMEPVLDRAP